MRRSLLIAACVIALSQFSAYGALSSANIYICAISDVQECVPLNTCKRVAPRQVNIAPIIVLDLEKKQWVSASVGDKGRKETIEGVKQDDKAIYLYGQQGEETWSAVISTKSGSLTASVNTDGTSFVLFGNCAPK